PALTGWDSPMADALALVAGATGGALVLAGITGRRPDWREPSSGPRPDRPAARDESEHGARSR
ncbi:MAG TPA: hypothetical protein VNK92_07195, partial [Vicinamibacterales bacterium]|nr:hypothetical protein [Vicinamibacterales bacterium]